MHTLPQNNYSIVKKIKFAFNRGGGFFYHYSAWKYRNTLWNPFARDIQRWIDNWRPFSKSLLLVGPSAGYFLDSLFLLKFNRIDILDPDPLAPTLFKKRFPRLKVHWHIQDLFSPKNGHWDVTRFEKLLQWFPGHAIMFTNFLGQLPVLHPQPAGFANWIDELNTLLDTREWASYHDRFSCREAPLKLSLYENQSLSTNELVNKMYNQNHRSLELFDHNTEGLFPDHPRRVLTWQRLKNHFHVIECIRSQNTR